ncbi:MAG: hypothetical protein JRF33_18605 [Deltaproteobacteria bacterium]|nr:hypothetical protein [Deltaproteobacteria bacterium]
MKNAKAILAGLVWTMLISCGDYSNQDLSEDLAFLRAIPSRSSLELRVADTSPRQDAITQAEGSLSIREDALRRRTICMPVWFPAGSTKASLVFSMWWIG